MKNVSLASISLSLLFAISACRSEAVNARPAPDSKEWVVLDFAPYPTDGKTVTLEEFLKACQEASGMNFTYSGATKDALSAKSVTLLETKRIRSGEFEHFLGTLLTLNGLEAEHIGPEHLHVLLIKPCVG
jgi:hypothetical protein